MAKEVVMPHPGINMYKIPVGGDEIGLMFLIGVPVCFSNRASRGSNSRWDVFFRNPPILNLKAHWLAGQRDPWLSESTGPRPDLSLTCRYQHGYRLR